MLNQRGLQQYLEMVTDFLYFPLSVQGESTRSLVLRYASFENFQHLTDEGNWVAKFLYESTLGDLPCLVGTRT